MPAAPAPAKPFDALQDSQLFDAENSEPLLSSGGGCSSSQDWHRARNSEVKAVPASPKRWQSHGSTQRHRARGTEAAVLYGVNIITPYKFIRIIKTLCLGSSRITITCFHVYKFLRTTAAPQMTATLNARSVLSAPSAPEAVSQQPRVNRKLPQAGKPTPSQTQVGKMSGRLLCRLSLREKSTKAPSGA